MNATISVAKNKFVVRAPFTQLGECQRIPSRRYVKSAKAWVAPITKVNSQYLLAAFDRAQWVDGARRVAEESANRKPPTHRPFPDWYTFKTQPYEFQRKGLDKAWAMNEFGLFMWMGTGKTKVTIDLLCARAIDGQITSALIICPLSVALSWRDQIMAHGTVKSDIVMLKSDSQRVSKSDFGVELADRFTWYVANIEGLSAGGLYNAVVSAIVGKKVAAVVDESQRIKNPQAIRTKRAHDISALAAQKLILTGTPTLKGPADLWAQFEFLNPDIIGAGDFYCFRNRYVVMGGYENKEIIGYQNLDELASLVEPYVYSVPKDVLGLPPKVYNTVRVELTPGQLSVIRTIKKDMRIGVKVLKNVLEKVLRLQQAAAGVLPSDGTREEGEIIPWNKNPKVAALRDIVEERTDSFIVWCTFKPEVKFVASLMEDLGIPYVIHTGDTKEPDRKEAINTFQSGKARAFIGTVQSGSIGITLTKATLVVYMSNSWALDHRIQSEDRAHRIGTTGTVLYYNIIAEESVDELIVEALEAKTDLSVYVKKLIEDKGKIRGVD